MADFKERLNEALAKRQMTAAKLARLSNVNEGAISQYRKGAYKATQENLERLAKTLNVSIAWLMGADVSMEASPLSYPNISPIPQMKKVPLLGTIACGEPILATENIEMYVDMPEKLHADFSLRCKGDSMINARIFDGDIVYIRQQPDVEDGEIAAVLIGDEATLKKVYKQTNKIILSACNPMYDDMVYQNEQLDSIRILGKAVGFTSLIKNNA